MAIYFSDAAQTRAAHVINAQQFSNTTRTSLSGTVGTANTDLWTWTYNKLVSTSSIMAIGYVHGYGDSAGSVRCNWRMGSHYHMGGWSYTYSGHNYLHGAPIHIPLNTYNGTQTTGNITMGIAYNVEPQNNGNKPFNRINPDNNDDSRLLSGTRSWVTVFEVLL